MNSHNDTIVALATPPGIGAIGVIRLSGVKAIEIANEIFPAKDLKAQATHTLHVGLLKEGDTILDEAVVSLYKQPRSYTGEDVIEISCHGSPFVQQQVITACIKKGARLAKAGEFTQRAFLNGKLDLTQAEAVADLIASNTTASQRTALHNIRGGFSNTLKALREELVRFSALIELELDFATEDVEFADRLQLLHTVEHAIQTTSMLADSFHLGNVIRNGVSVAIVGKPNAGKSTLLNALLNEERAIVSEIPGTTRDTIEEVINIEGVLFRLIDTAGIRSHTEDRIEIQGIERSLQKMESADLVLMVVDGEERSKVKGQRLNLEELELTKKNKIIVANKSDLLTEEERSLLGEEVDVFISARDGKGIDELKKTMVREVMVEDLAGENVVVTNARHHAALMEVLSSLREVKKGLADRIPGDLLALDIRRAMHYLGEITGEITNEEQLDWIFSKFCIGK